MTVAISVEHLSKRYLIRHQAAERYTALRDVLANGAKRLGQTLARPFLGRDAAQGGNRAEEEFWALKDVNFEIRNGACVGIIGRNGAGKSTLLKILSRVTEPTKGRIRIAGRVASLLEVGTGFHPELTGRENIFLNGAVLGMRRLEISRRLDEIVSFAGVEKFLDTPVKRYSSGMYMRLAFAVAAHVDPEILIVDEVLAVGDAEFQKKCMGKMEHVGKQGRTVLFVSHNMSAIEQLCTSAMLLELGQVHSYSSDVMGVIRNYLTRGNDQQVATVWRNQTGVFDNPWFAPISLSITDEEDQEIQSAHRNDREMWVKITARISQASPALTIGYAIYAEDGVLLYWSYQSDGAESERPQLSPGTVTLRSRIPPRFLNEGTYRIEIIGGLHCKEWLFEPGKNCPGVWIEIQGGLSDSTFWMTRRPGVLAPVMPWSIVEQYPE